MPSLSVGRHFALHRVYDRHRYFVTCTYDGSNEKMYVNGTLAATGSTTATPLTGTGNLYVGGGSSGWYFPGIIDDVRVYDRALSANEIGYLYFQTAALMGNEGDLVYKGSSHNYQFCNGTIWCAMGPRAAVPVLRRPATRPTSSTTAPAMSCNIATAAIGLRSANKLITLPCLVFRSFAVIIRRRLVSRSANAGTLDRSRPALRKLLLIERRRAGRSAFCVPPLLMWWQRPGR